MERCKSLVKRCLAEYLDNMGKSTPPEGGKHAGMQAGAAEEGVRVRAMKACSRTQNVLTCENSLLIFAIQL